KRLRAVIERSVRTLATLTEEMTALSGENKEHARARLLERIEAVSGEAGFDPVRLQQEAAILIDRLDISEECDRLRSHLAGMEGLLKDEGEAGGKRFDFLVQEAFREMNTASSKSAHAGISERVVAAKTELEKIREQIKKEERPMEKGDFLFISTPSGSGKTTICRMLAQRVENIQLSVSYTTRPRKEGEVDGKDYYF